MGHSSRHNGILGYTTNSNPHALFQGEKISDVQAKIEQNVTQQNGGATTLCI